VQRIGGGCLPGLFLPSPQNRGMAPDARRAALARQGGGATTGRGYGRRGGDEAAAWVVYRRIGGVSSDQQSPDGVLPPGTWSGFGGPTRRTGSQAHQQPPDTK
jgi:hypothetical protein